MTSMQAGQITAGQAMRLAPDHAATLAAMAAAHRHGHTQVNQCQTIRHWQPSAATYCYQTHIAVADQHRDRLEWLTDVFFNAATLTRQPWYPQFAGGSSQTPGETPSPGISRHQFIWGRFHVGLPSPRYYRQLVSLARPDASTAVIVARSVTEGPPLPAGARLAYTLDPNGEVLHWENGRIHWHHICCTPGIALLPGRLDRWFINSLRRLGLDRAERDTYRAEAEGLRDWLQSAEPEDALDFTH
ncbi:MAG: hypothetical protein R3E50_03145 [Halioglobus sp.]